MDAKALLRFLLSVLARITAIDGGREKLRQLLELRAKDGNDSDSTMDSHNEQDLLTQRRHSWRKIWRQRVGTMLPKRTVHAKKLLAAPLIKFGRNF